MLLFPIPATCILNTILCFNVTPNYKKNCPYLIQQIKDNFVIYVNHFI